MGLMGLQVASATSPISCHCPAPCPPASWKPLSPPYSPGLAALPPAAHTTLPCGARGCRDRKGEGVCSALPAPPLEPALVTSFQLSESPHTR